MQQIPWSNIHLFDKKIKWRIEGLDVVGMPVILALKRQRWEEHKFQAIQS